MRMVASVSASAAGRLGHGTASTSTSSSLSGVTNPNRQTGSRVRPRCLHRIDKQSLGSSHPDALARRREAERRRQQRRRTKDATTEVNHHSAALLSFDEQLTTSEPNRSLLDQAADTIEGLLLQRGGAGIKGQRTCRTRGELDRTVREAPAKSGIVVAQFTAPWCRACDAVNKVVREAIAAHEDVTFVKVCVGKSGPKMCRDLGVKKLPWFQIYSAEEDADPRVVVNVHANKQNQRLLSRQLDQLKQMKRRAVNAAAE